LKRGKKEQVKSVEKRSGLFNLHLIVLTKTLHQRDLAGIWTLCT